MNKKASKLLVIFGSIFAGLYILFLLLPFILLPLLNTFSSKFAYEIEHLTGFKTEFTKFRIVTTPKLTVGAKLGNIQVFQPDGRLFLSGENFQFKMSLIPLLAKRIEADIISADSFNLNLVVKNDGHFLIEDLFKSDETSEAAPASENEAFSLPLGFKLSNHLPDFKLNSHKISFIENNTGKEYVISGSDTKITDFILNKKIKIQSKGNLVLDGFEAFDYDIKVLNRLMPDIDINDLLAADSSDTVSNQTNSVDFNILDAFKTIKNNGFKAALTADIKTSGTFEAPEFEGEIKADKISMLLLGKKLPDSDFNLLLNKNEFNLNSNLYSASDEVTIVNGLIKSGKSPKIDLTCKSNATIKNIFDILNVFAKIAGINDLQTLTGGGRLDINFNINSDLKKITSNGYFKLLNGFISYGLYDVRINDLVSDILLDNNTILINKLGLSVLSVPLNITGKITPDAKCDIKISTSSLPLKGLLISLGQAALLKDNTVNSGVVTVLLNIKENLTAPKITGNISLDNLNLKNIPSDIVLSLNPVNISVNSTKTGFEGTFKADNIKAVNPAVTVSAKTVTGTLNEKNITVDETLVLAGKNEITVSGQILDYLTEKIALDFKTSGKINSTLTGNLNPYKMTLDLKYLIPENAFIIIPGFDKSALNTKGSVNISGSMLNPLLKGQFNVSSVEIPEIPVTIKDMVLNLNGEILNGNMTIADFTSGGIKAQNIKSDYKMKGSDFYLDNMAGSAFDGTFNGDIVYNMSNTACDVKFSGKNMNALKAIEGAAGIKNALTGTLSFDADVNFKGVEYDDMMKTLKGKADFEILNGVLANLGSLKTLLNAQNIIQNSVLKTAANSAATLPAVQSASEFDYIKGSLTFSNSWANLNSIKMSGPSMAYYVTGKFHLLNGSANAVILGRLSQSVVGVLGGIGDLAVQKLTSLIPALGNLSSSLAKVMNETPEGVKTDEIPSLRSSETAYKDFRAVFNGGVESQASVKSFRWLNNIDTTALDTQATSVVPQLSDIKENAKADVQNAVSTAKTTVTQAKEELNQTKEQAKELFKSLLSVPKASE